MGESLKRLSFGFLLIAMASAVLLLSEAPRQKPRDTTAATAESAVPTRTMRVAMFQMASQPIIDEGAQGVIDSLKEAGFVEGKNLKLTRFNAEGDIATGNAISQELAGGDFDLVITLTTGALQSFANVNKQRKAPHVFGLVSDPVKAGVGIGTEPMDHPAHLTGIGTFPPVDQALELARKISPKLSKVGIGWNPAEINSEVCTKLAREVCKKLKIELLEANVENTSTVKEAVR
jgi:putative ABC transport system substrate-binding protein